MRVRRLLGALALTSGTIACAYPGPATSASQIPGESTHAPGAAEPVNLILNGSVEEGTPGPVPEPAGWARETFAPPAVLTWDDTVAHDGRRSLKIKAPVPNDIRWLQTVAVRPDTNYLLSGWIKTEDVANSPEAVNAGANLSVDGTWMRTTPAALGTQDWTYVSLVFNSGADRRATIAARLGYWSGTTTGTAWFDDLQLTAIPVDSRHPSWKVLVLVYGNSDLTFADGLGGQRRVVASASESDKTRAASAARRFVETDIPALTSGNMIPQLTLRFPERTLTQLSRNGSGWWPAPQDVKPELDPAFDSVIVIWNARGIDQHTGQKTFLGGDAAGLTTHQALQQTYSALVLDAAISYGHLNVFKHEWGHSILGFYNYLRTTPTPHVLNHAGATTYVHCGTGKPYVWMDETDSHPIPNSIYNDQSGFTHDYYSGTTALPTQPDRCLGITPRAWTLGGPVSKPPRQRMACGRCSGGA